MWLVDKHNTLFTNHMTKNFPSEASLPLRQTMRFFPLPFGYFLII